MKLSKVKYCRLASDCTLQNTCLDQRPRLLQHLHKLYSDKYNVEQHFYGCTKILDLPTGQADYTGLSWPNSLLNWKRGTTASVEAFVPEYLISQIPKFRHERQVVLSPREYFL